PRQWKARAGGGAEDELFGNVAGERAVGLLAVGKEHLRLARPLQAAHADVAYHADHGALGEGEVEAFAERVFVRPGPLRQRLADDRDEGLPGGIRLRDVASAAQGDAEGREVLRRHVAQAHTVRAGADDFLAG